MKNKDVYDLSQFRIRFARPDMGCVFYLEYEPTGKILTIDNADLFKQWLESDYEG